MGATGGKRQFQKHVVIGIGQEWTVLTVLRRAIGRPDLGNEADPAGVSFFE